MVRLLVSKVAARSSARCLPLPCSSSTIAKRRSVRFIYSPLRLLDCSLASPFSLAYHVLLCLTTSLLSFLRSAFFHGCRDCRVGDRLEICAWSARDPGGRRDRTGQLRCRSARVCCHLCHCRCRIGDTDRESPRSHGSQDVTLLLKSGCIN